MSSNFDPANRPRSLDLAHDSDMQLRRLRSTKVSLFDALDEVRRLAEEVVPSFIETTQGKADYATALGELKDSLTAGIATLTDIEALS